MTKIKKLIDNFYFQWKAKHQNEFINSITYKNMAVFNSYMAHNIHFKGWPQPLYEAVRNARYGTPESEYMVNALLEAGADTNSKYFSALGMALDNFLDRRGPGIVSYETYIREKTWQAQQPQKSQIETMEEGAFRVLTNILRHGAVPNVHQQKTIDNLRENNPYFEAFLLKSDMDKIENKKNIKVEHNFSKTILPAAKKMKHKI